MGDLRDWSPEPSGREVEERRSSSSLNKATEIGEEYWRRAEAAAQGIIAQVQPTVVSETRRKAVIDYVQRLIRGCLGCEVFPFGSVPLKTYLPDGDIDLTAFGALNFEEALASDVCSILEREDQNSSSQFIVKDVQLIRAEVKLVKCLVQNIVVDISFNQLGGLCTLCFLEQVDRLIGKDHLFKRSIILIKAWCYYESRILGAHHGLISTYALETLVLYVFHLFHVSLDGPLAVLFKFLEYFSKFDWDNYCISLHGPVRISYLPEIVAEMPEIDGRDLLLSKDFLRDCAEKFSVPSRGFGTFHSKHLNIVDPLKETNNLGRSVSKGNFYRIRSAFTYGARKLGHILSLPVENIDAEICKFFSNTLDRHGSGQRPDVQDPAPVFGNNDFGVASFSGTESLEHGTFESESGNSSGLSGKCRLDHELLLNNGVSKVEISGTDMGFGRTVDEPETSLNMAPSAVIYEVENSANGTLSDCHISGDAEDLASSRIRSSSVPPNSFPSNDEDGASSLGKPLHANHPYYSHRPNGNLNDGNFGKCSDDSGFTKKSLSHEVLPLPADQTALSVNGDLNENQLGNHHEGESLVGSNHHSLQSSSVTWPPGGFFPGNSSYRASVATGGSPEGPKSISDLSGDYESNIRSLNYGRWCYEYASGTPIAPMHAQFPSKKPWDVLKQSMQFNQNIFSHINANGVIPRPYYPMNPPILPGGVTFCVEEMPKPRGTGTYIPNMNHYRDKPLMARGKSYGSLRSPRSYSRAMSHMETSFPERSSHDHELAVAQFSPRQSSGRSESLDLPFGSPGRRAYSEGNGSTHPYERVVEFGSIGHLPVEGPMPEISRKVYSSSAATANPMITNISPERQKPNAALTSEQDRIAAKSYQLKDEGDFPPLSI